jgi:hypothetical protein
VDNKFETSSPDSNYSFASLNSNYLTLRRVEKTEEESKNRIKYVWNELKSPGDGDL